MKKTQKPSKHKHKPKEQTYEARITITKRGTGIANIIELDKKAQIEPENLGLALDKDIVILKINGNKKQDPLDATVLSVSKRSKVGFTGVLTKRNNQWFVRPDDPKADFSIVISESKRNKAKSGQQVFVVIEKWTKRNRPPLGRVEKILGTPGQIDSEMHGIALEKGFDWEFPKKVLQEAKKLPSRITKKDIEERVDMRHVTTFTIDPADAKDFDDALSIQKVSDTRYEIGIHIADVSFYVQPGTKLNEEAYDRATSVYLVDRTIPMLPETLSNDLCSLNPNEDKRTFSAVFTMDSDGSVVSEWFGRTLIHSDKRFTYEEAQEVLEKKQGLFAEELTILNTIAKKLNKERLSQGALSLETEEVKFKLTDEGKPYEVVAKERKDAHKLIEEFMLLANRRVARFCGIDTKNKPRLSVYRIHEKPTREKTQELVSYLELLGYNLKLTRGIISGKDLNKLTQSLDENTQHPVQTMIIRSMQKARYSTKNAGHFGLAFEYYTHFTSPIRRYPDILVHRILQTYLDGKTIPKKYQTKYEEQCEHSSNQEKEAMEAERKSVKIKQVEYMTDHIGEEFDGIITGLTNWGIYVEETHSKSEGLIPLRSLTDDSYVFNSQEFVIRGDKQGKEFRLGQKIKIKVISTNLDDYTIDYGAVL